MTVEIRNDELRAAANADYQFRYATRRWTSQLLLRVGDDKYLLDILDGEVRRFERTTDQFQSFDATLGGPVDVWEQLLRPVPAPFYQDFIGVWFNHGFEISGDMRIVFTHYWALLRLLTIMRNTASDGTQAV